MQRVPVTEKRGRRHSSLVTVVVPVFNERDNVAPLISEIVAALRGLTAFEIVYIDDHSRYVVGLDLKSGDVYSGDKAGPFVNGVLGAIARSGKI